MEMMVSLSEKTAIFPFMKWEMIALVTTLVVLPVSAQSGHAERKSLLDADPEVVYLERTLKKPIELKVLKEAPVFANKDGQRRLGYLKADQKVRLEAVTEKVYRVRGQGTRNGISGWVAPWAFSSTDPKFIENLKHLYHRQIQVQKLIDSKQVAVGMTLDEVFLSLGKATKTSVRKTANGQSGRWEFIEYTEVKHYTTTVDPMTGGIYRQLAYVTQEEKGKTAVEFEDDVVSAVEESEERKGGQVRIVVPPLIFRW